MFTRSIHSLLITFVLAVTSLADPLGSAFTYQGQLKNAGSPANGPFNMEFRLFDADTLGNQIGPTLVFDGVGGNPPPVSVANGLFTLELDFGAGSYNGDQRWLDITVNSTPLTPRVKTNPAPHAIHALNADLLDGLDSAAFLQSVPTPLVLVGNSPTEIISVENTGSGRGVYAVTAGATCVQGRSTAASGAAYGGHFTSDSTSGTGVFGLAPNTGVFGSGATGVGAAGTAFGVLATTSNSGGYGVYAVNSSSGTGVFGQSGGAGTGVAGYALSGGTGVYGEGANGIHGFTNNPGGSGVLAENPGGGFGVAGISSGWAVFASGNMAATGTKAFRIDHPFDPANKYLLHYCSEGPEPLNLYTGNVVTDARGYAVIALPDYFEAINRDFRYQLTVIDSGDDFVLAKVVQKIQNNQFVIRTSKPNVEVSWEVKAVRNDLWVRTYSAPVEQEKAGHERGKYQHPELYGQPKEKGMHYDAERERPLTPASPRLRPLKGAGS